MTSGDGNPRLPAQLVAAAWPVLGLGLLVIALGVVGSLAAPGLQRTITSALVMMVVVVGLYVFIGNSGVVSFGHISFMAIGAYTSALLAMPPALKAARLDGLPAFVAEAQLPVGVAALVGAIAAAAFAFVIGQPLMRLSGLAAAIATFSILLIVFTVINNWTNVTAGPSVLVGVPIRTSIWPVVAWGVLSVIVAYVYGRSRYALRLRASREDEPAAQSLSVHIARSRLGAFVLSAGIVAIGGSLHGHLQGAFDASAFYLTMTFITIVMLVVGGIGSLAGAVIGSLLVSGLSEALRRAELGFDVGPLTVPSQSNLRELGLGMVLLIVLIRRPQGIFGFRELRWPFSRIIDRGMSASTSSAVPDPGRQVKEASDRHI